MALLGYDGFGRPIQQQPTQSDVSHSVINQGSVQLLPTKAIPIIFLPGIMGSPLMADGKNGDVVREDNRWAWFPDCPKGWVAGIAGSGYRGFRNTTPEERRVLLNPEATWALTPEANDIDADVKDSIKKSLSYTVASMSNTSDGGITGETRYANIMSLEEALRRGWATVFWSGYGGILSFLEKNLRQITYANESMLKSGSTSAPFPVISAINALVYQENHAYRDILRKDFPAVDPDAAASASLNASNGYLDEIRAVLKAGKNYHYPVFAIGYNWTRCNADSAEYAYNRIMNQIIPHVKNTLGWQCDDGVILLTHSMGGLVARSMVKQFSDTLKILAVIHGVQPCNGAATLYARMWAGWESGKNFLSGPIDYTMNSIAGRSLGLTRAELLPILANSPGAMELAPNQNYAKDWLRIYEHVTNKLLKSLPEKDPYSEIYLQTNNWLRLGSFEQMNPGATTPEQLQETAKGYRKIIETVQGFHQDIDNYFHDNTYLIYGQFEDHLTWGAVNLRIEGLTWRHKVEYRDDLSEIYRLDRLINVSEVDRNDMVSRNKGRYRIEYIERAVNVEPVPSEVVDNAVFRDERAVPQREGGNVDIEHDGKTYQVHMQGGQEPGDGTVPYNSANPWKSIKDPWDKKNWGNPSRSTVTPESIRYIFEGRNASYEHSGSYNERISQDIAFYSMMSIIKNKLIS